MRLLGGRLNLLCYILAAPYVYFQQHLRMTQQGYITVHDSAPMVALALHRLTVAEHKAVDVAHISGAKARVARKSAAC